MKNLKFLMALVMALFCLNASAQFTTSGSSSKERVSGSGWNSFYLQFNPSTFNIDIKHADNQNFNGLLLGYSKAFSLSSSIPLFFEVGGGLEYSFFSEDYEDDYYYDEYKSKFSMLSIKVPVNVIYNFEIPNSTVAIAPYAGLRFRGILLAKEKYEDDYDDETIDYFDKDDVGKDNVWKRFQVGIQTGANIKFNNKFFVGVGYGLDLSEVCDKTKISEVSISAGLIF